MSYAGGKGGAGVYQSIINLMPPHRTYIEPFLGHGSIMRQKRPARVSIGIDLDADALARWRGNEAPNLKLMHGDGIKFLQSFKFSGDELVYCDPPYVMAARSSKRAIYKCEMDDAQHVELLETLKLLPCLVLISGYWSDLYAEHLDGWRTASFQTTTRGGTLATEFVWVNFPAPVELHDYKFLGTKFRERERIKRKKQRWRAKLEKMPELERHAIMSAIQEMRAAADSARCGDAPARRRRISTLARGDDAHRHRSPQMTMFPMEAKP